MSKVCRSNLIITRAGANSLHREWIADSQDRNFDLLVAAYDDTIVRDGDSDGVFHRYIPGPKISGWMKIFREDVELLDRYAQIALIDDDVQAGAFDLSRCFDIGAQYALKLWQPSLSWNSYATYGATLQNKSFRLRFVNFIEMMCPFFSSQCLRSLLPTFELGLESGIDLIWCSIANEKTRTFAIIDEVCVSHTRPVGDQKSMNGFVDRSYETDVDACLDLFSAQWPSCVASSGISKSGRIIEPQLYVALKTLPQIFAIAAAPRGNRTYRFKSVADHIRHQWTRKPIYVPDATSKLLQVAKDLPAEIRAASDL
jgi:hypothetical protein